MISHRVADAWLIAAAVFAWLAFAVAFGLPGITLDWGRDLFVFFGQINALEHGQVPYRDFRTSMGALPFYLPWFGYLLADGFGGALEIAGLLATALLLPCIVVVLRPRFSLPTKLALLLCLTALAAAPVTQAMPIPSQIGFYNRWCCSALTALLLLVVPARRPASPSLEGAAVAALLLFLFFVKASYFAVGLVFVVGFGAVLGLFRRAALLGAGIFAVVVGAGQIATGLIDDYLAELAHSLDVSGVSWYARGVFIHYYLPDSAVYYGVVVVACALAVKADLCWRRWTFVLFALLSSLALLGHDGSFSGPFPLLATLALLGERTAKTWRRWHSCLLALFMLPHLTAAARTASDYRQASSALMTELPRMADVYIADLRSIGAPIDNLRHCLAVVAAELGPGLRLLEKHDIGDGVLALDYYNWFPVLLDVPPLVGRLAVLMPGRTMDPDTAPPPADVFRQVQYVMIPKEPTLDRRFLLSLYGEHISRRYRLLDSNYSWQLWERKRL